MRLAKPLLAALAVSMASAPVLAQSAAPLSLTASAFAGALQDDAAVVEEDSILLPALAIAGVLAAAILFTSNEDSEGLGNPASP